MGQRVIGSGSLFFDFPFFLSTNSLFLIGFFFFFFSAILFLSSDSVGTLFFFIFDTTDTVGSILQVPRDNEVVAVI